MFERYQEIQKRKGDRDWSESGFTLIELLIVIVVIGILAAIVVFSLSGVTGQSKAAACTSDAKSVEIAADAYQAKNSTFAPSIGALVPAYLKTAPTTTNGYTIAMGTGANAGDVMVTPTTGAAYVFQDNTGCTGIS